MLIHNLFNKYILALGNGAFWSLGLEEQLYALYAVFLLLRARFGLSRAFRGVLALSLSWYAVGVASTRSFKLLPATWGFWPLNWWAVWLLANFFDGLVSRTGGNAETAFSNLGDIAAAVLAVLVVVRISGWQEKKAKAG